MSTYFPPGRYWGKTTRIALGKAKTGNPQVVISFLVLGKVDQDNPDGELIPCEQYERSIFRTITSEETAGYLFEDLAALNIEATTFAVFDPQSPNYHQWGGIEFEAYCQHDEYEGKKRERWRVSRGDGGGLEVKPLEPAAVRKLDSLYGKKFKAKKATPAKTEYSEPVGAPEPQESEAAVEDIPF